MKVSVPDGLGGVLVFALGLFVFLYTQDHYRVGTARSMGPGFFPATMGLVTMGTGALIALSALRRAEPTPRVAWREAFFIFASIAAFSFGMRWFGLVPAIFLTVTVASLGDRESRPFATLLLASGVSVFCWAVFSKGLGMTMPAFRMPF